MTKHITYLDYGTKALVVYGSRCFEDGVKPWPSTSIWLVPGTWID